MKKSLFLAVSLVLVGGLIFPVFGFARSQETGLLMANLGVKSVGLLPTSPLYFLKEASRGVQMFFTFNSVKKAELKLKIADEKLVEAKVVSENEPQNETAIKKAVENYEQQTDALKTSLEALKTSNQDKNVQNLFEKVADTAVKHESVLETLPLKKEIKDSYNSPDALSTSDPGKVLLMPDIKSQPKGVKVLSPNGGETWPLESQKLIKWSGPSSIYDGYEIMLLSSDKTKSWVIGRYGVSTFWGGIATLWTVGNHVSCSQSVCEKIQPGEYYIRITNLKSRVSDDSDGLFNISPAGKRTISVISPNGGEKFGIGETMDISWTTSVDTELVVKLAPANERGEYDITKPQHNIRARLSQAGATEKYQWEIPNTVKPGKYIINVSRYCCGEGIQGIDYNYSDAPFSIVSSVGNDTSSNESLPKPAFKIISPNGGEVWRINETHDIRWQTSLPSDTGVQIILLKQDANGVWRFFQGISDTEAPTENDGSYSWKIPVRWCLLDGCNNTLDGEYRVRVQVFGLSEREIQERGLYDDSDFSFRILSSSVGTNIKVIVPNSGEAVFKIGLSYGIQWDATNAQSVKIGLLDTRYDYFSESPFGSVLIAEVPNDGRDYFWRVPDQITDPMGRIMKLGAGKVYKITIYTERPGGSCVPGKCDESDETFSIIPDDGIRG